MDHHMGSGASGTMPGHEDKMPFGNRPTEFMCRDSAMLMQKPSRGNLFVATDIRVAEARDGGRGSYMSGFGVDFKEMLEKARPVAHGFGDSENVLPYHDNYVELNKEKLDTWGIPTLTINVTGARMKNDVARYCGASGGNSCRFRREDISVFFGDVPPGLGIHEMGTRAWAAIQKLPC